MGGNRPPPVYFVRPGAMLPLPVPVQGGSVSELFDLINVPDQAMAQTERLSLGWLVSTLRPSRPMPLLALHAEQGKRQIDDGVHTGCGDRPASSEGLRIRPKDEETVMVAITKRLGGGYDNLSSMPPWLSDRLCCLSTGGQPHGADEVQRRQRKRLCVRNVRCCSRPLRTSRGRSDLLDRMIVLTTIPEARRRTERCLGGIQHRAPSHLGRCSATAHASRTLPAS